MKISSENSSKFYWITILSLLFIFFLAGLRFQIFAYFPKISILIILIGFALLLKSGRLFFKDWYLFLAFIYLTDTLRGLIYYLVSKYQLPVYCEYVLKAEQSIFRTVPSVWLQNKLLGDAQFGLLEELVTFFHGTHFIAFLIIGFFIWLKDKENFRVYKLSFYLLMVMGISLYALIPTAPPWMASNLFGLLPPLRHFNLEIYTAIIPDLTAGFNTDPVAAMPSLHAAFPFLCSLLLFKRYKFRAFPFYLYTAAIFFSIIYTGDHYVADIIAGIVLAITGFVLANHLTKNYISFAHQEKSSELWLRRSNIVAGTILIVFSLVSGEIIKPELKKYYAEYSHLKFPVFINHSEKADSNYLIAVYLGDFEANQHNIGKASYYYEKAQTLAKTTYEKNQIKMKINRLRLSSF